MKRVLYTQRVEIVESYGERRDCADQNIFKFIDACGYVPIPVSNVIKDIGQYVDELHPSGIILTGGNSLEIYGGNAPERDYTDEVLIQKAIKEEILLFGFCRGMQSILHYFGCKLSQISGHVAIRHELTNEYGDKQFQTNSFHNQGCLREDIKAPLQIIAYAKDEIVEWIRHTNMPIEAIMWHPEREAHFKERDMRIIKNLFR